MGGIELLIKILSDPNPELQLLSTETVANLAKFRKARKIVRKNGGIPKLVDLLDVDPTRVSVRGIALAKFHIRKFLEKFFTAVLGI